MKTQLSKPVRGRASYTEEYKQEALELWRASGRTAAKVATELGIRPPLLYRWARLERMDGEDAAKAGAKPSRSLKALEAEIRPLRAENAKLLARIESEMHTCTRVRLRVSRIVHTGRLDAPGRSHLPRYFAFVETNIKILPKA